MINTSEIETDGPGNQEAITPKEILDNLIRAKIKDIEMVQRVIDEKEHSIRNSIAMLNIDYALLRAKHAEINMLTGSDSFKGAYTLYDPVTMHDAAVKQEALNRPVPEESPRITQGKLGIAGIRKQDYDSQDPATEGLEENDSQNYRG